MDEGANALRALPRGLRKLALNLTGEPWPFQRGAERSASLRTLMGSVPAQLEELTLLFDRTYLGIEGCKILAAELPATLRNAPRSVKELWDRWCW